MNNSSPIYLGLTPMYIKPAVDFSVGLRLLMVYGKERVERKGMEVEILKRADYNKGSAGVEYGRTVSTKL